MTTTPMEQPDGKDWTWVLGELCGECGFDVRSFPKEEVGARLRQAAGEWAEILAGDEDTLRIRPRADKWSPLEYAFHVRDVFELYDERLVLMLEQDGPHYANWDQDVTAVEKNYNAADPNVVSAEMVELADRLADRFDAVTGDTWERTGFRSDGAAFTVETFARYFLHDPMHHLWDVRTG